VNRQGAAGIEVPLLVGADTVQGGEGI
jgi:hypothetical protein